MAKATSEWIDRTGQLQTVRAYIENNLEWGNLTPTTTARALGMSVRQLHLLFEPTGTTFSRYVLARRLERVRAQLVVQPRRKVIEIAFASGIESAAAFYRAFRASFGTTPTAYRRSQLRLGVIVGDSTCSNQVRTYQAETGKP